MKDMVSKQPFTMRMKTDYCLSKLIAIDSDLAEDNLALSDEDCKLLSKNVNIVFHVAASVKFEAPLEVNMKHNVVATRSLLDIACKFAKLQCFVHVSTAYSNCQLRQIDERVYTMDVPDDLENLKVTKQMLDNRPNTYTYTKAMAENVATKYASKMNVVIVRPSIVMSSLMEPAAGWVDTINGPVGLSILGALGILQKIKVNSEVVFDLIPADTVSNALVSIAWASTERRNEFLPGSSPSMALPIEKSTDTKENQDPLAMQDSANNLLVPECALTASQQANNVKSQVAKKISELEANARRAGQGLSNLISGRRSFNAQTQQQQQQQNQVQSLNKNNIDSTVRVFNLTTGSENPCSFYHYFSLGRDEAYKHPSTRVLRPLLTIPKQKGMNAIQYLIYKLFSHILFAHIIDMILNLTGQKRMCLKAVGRMHHANDVFDYFCSNQWTFVTDNVKRLRDLQSTHDKEHFNCDVRQLDWDAYARLGWLGCRKFILKEDDSTIEYARRRYKVICLLYYLTKIIISVSLTLTLGHVLFRSYPLIATAIMLPIYAIIYLL